MSSGLDANVDQIDFDYSPEQLPTAEQRIEVLELQVSEMREQIGALVDHLSWLTNSQSAS